jgi:DNA-binding XRE family transcriptional regulator
VTVTTGPADYRTDAIVRQSSLCDISVVGLWPAVYRAGMSTALLDCPPMQVFDHKRMRELREGCGLTQAAAAKRANMPQSRWSDIESGARTNVTVETMGRVAAALGCNAQDLLTPPEE